MGDGVWTLIMRLHDIFELVENERDMGGSVLGTPRSWSVSVIEWTQKRRGDRI